MLLKALLVAGINTLFVVKRTSHKQEWSNGMVDFRNCSLTQMLELHDDYLNPQDYEWVWYGLVRPKSYR